MNPPSVGLLKHIEKCDEDNVRWVDSRAEDSCMGHQHGRQEIKKTKLLNCDWDMYPRDARKE